MNKALLQAIVSVAEIVAYLFTAVGALAGVTYLVFNRQLVKIVETEHLKERGVMAGQISGLGAATAEAIRKTEEARNEQERLKGDNLRLQVKVEEERTARLLIEARIAPRRVSSKHRARFALKITTVHRTLVRILLIDGVADGDDFANDLANLLIDAGFSVERTRGNMAVTPRDLSITFGKRSESIGRALAAELVKSGLAGEPMIYHMATEDIDHIVLMVGLRLP